MSQTPFRFKQFAVAHDKCAMKVNTDGVLVGAWAEVSNVKRILDIGTGTGVIALMMAQRNKDAFIDAIDIDESAYLQAKDNFEQSPWADRLQAIHTALQQFIFVQQHPAGAQVETVATQGYDLIISNPPYFIDDFKSGKPLKDIARHSLALNYADLLAGTDKLLAPSGRACLVLPIFNLALLQTLAAKHSLFVCRLTEVTAVIGKQPYLALIQLQRREKPIEKTTLCIQNAQGGFTDDYKALTREFYLKF